MARYVTFAKYSSKAAAAVFEGGFENRRKVLSQYIEGLGGTIIDMYAVADEEWDFMAILDADDFTPAKRAAHALLTGGSGALERAVTYTLADLAEVDAARSSIPGYTPPGS